MNVIEAEHLSKTFRVKQKEKGMKGSLKAIFRPQTEEINAVNNVSFSVQEGEMLAFIGPNGAGKSTTIKMLTGILYPDGGKVKVLGIDPTKKRRALSYQIGTVFGQKEQLWTHLTPYDNFRFFGAIYDIGEKEIETRIRELSDTFDLNAFLNTPVRNLSLGQRIRCEIVASLIHRPKVLFLDEPTIGLDPVVKDNIRSLIKQMNRELHTTIFLTSHDVGDIEKLCKRIIIVNSGQIVLDDSMEHLKYHYLNRKILEVKLQEETTLPQVNGITILKQKGSHVTLEVDTTVMKINDALRNIDTEHVEDINISNVPLENIIMEIYKSEEGSGSSKVTEADNDGNYDNSKGAAADDGKSTAANNDKSTDTNNDKYYDSDKGTDTDNGKYYDNGKSTDANNRKNYNNEKGADTNNRSNNDSIRNIAADNTERREYK